MSEDHVKSKEIASDTNEEKVVITNKKPEPKKTSVQKEIISWVILIAAAFILSYIITHFIIIKAEVPTSSMETTIMTHDKIVGNRLAYLFSEPERGDIVLFYLPDSIDAGEPEIYIKRILGLPGDTLEIIDGMLFINGALYEEDYLKEDMIGSFGPFNVPEGNYFMMGDNRNVSFDSRKWQQKYVPKDEIIGEAWFRYSPSWGSIS